MGNAKSTEEVVIAQSAIGDSTTKVRDGFSLSEWLLMVLVAIALLVLAYVMHRRCKKDLRRTVAREIYKNELRKSQNNLAEEQV